MRASDSSQRCGQTSGEGLVIHHTLLEKKGSSRVLWMGLGTWFLKGSSVR